MSDKIFDKVCVKFSRVKNYVDNSKYFLSIDGQNSLKEVVKDVKNIIFKNLC